MKNKRGYFFSLDALFALLIILGVVLFIKPSNNPVSIQVNVQEDILTVLSTIKIGELDNSYVAQWIGDGNITDLDKSVLEQIGDFYANNKEQAQILSQDIFDDLDLPNNVGLYFDFDELARTGSLDFDDAMKVNTARQIISGVQGGNGSTGYASRAFLGSKNKVSYFYFGGYIGDGNITVRVGGDVTGMSVDGVFSTNFSILLNGYDAGDFSPTPNVPYHVGLDHLVDYLNPGANYLEFNSNTGDNLYIAGGYVKFVHNETAPSDGKKYFPGVDGLINTYDGFYVPGNLNSMEIFLHYNSSLNLSLRMGNEIIYEGNSGGAETTTTIFDSTLSSILDYNSLSHTTTPLRLGLDNVSYVVNVSIDADTVSVTDLSGSMCGNCQGALTSCCRFSTPYGTCTNYQEYCEGCGGVCTAGIYEVKDANELFIDAVLNKTGNRVGLVGYRGIVSASDTHALSSDNVSLKNEIDEWLAQGSTCICCGINSARNMINSQSSNNKSKSIVVMTDGYANVECTQQGNTPDLNGNGVADDAGDDAIRAACDAYNENITVYAVAFGPAADANTTAGIASCGHGGAFYGNISQILGIYENISSQIITASYYEQTILSEGIYSKLFPDSYILLNYNKTVPSYGLVITTETSVFNNSQSQGSFIIPNDALPYEVRVISYSGSRWTSRVDVYDNATGTWGDVYDLADYGSEYTELGDPYVVNIPLSQIVYGNNSVRVYEGLGSAEYLSGSPYNKIIYSTIKNVSSFSPVVPYAEGCNWYIELEDGSLLPVIVPEGYTGTNDCYYGSSTGIIFDDWDAIQYSVKLLLDEMDLDGNQKLETRFSDSDITLEESIIEGIPFTWDTEVQVRVWS